VSNNKTKQLITLIFRIANVSCHSESHHGNVLDNLPGSLVVAIIPGGQSGTIDNVGYLSTNSVRAFIAT